MNVSRCTDRSGRVVGCCAYWTITCLLVLLLVFTWVPAAPAAGYQTTNFLVMAETSSLAKQIAQAAEQHRKELAESWMGRELPRWQEPCVIHVFVKDTQPSGVTSFGFYRGELDDCRMRLEGPLDRIQSAVLPHEVNHTVLASYFRQPLPRWVDEGLCLSVEDHDEQARQRRIFRKQHQAGRTMPLVRLLTLEDYPEDFIVLYTQGYSVTQFLLQHGGKARLLAFVKDGMRRGDWSSATRRHYGYTTLTAMQHEWLTWVEAEPTAPGSTQLVTQVSSQGTRVSAMGQ